MDRLVFPVVPVEHKGAISMANQSEIVKVPQTVDEYQPQWGTWTRRLVIVGLIIAVVYGMTLLAPVMNLLSMTFLLSLIMFAPSRLLTQYLHVPYGIAVTLCYGLVILLLAVALTLFIPASVDATNSLRRNAEQRYAQLQDTLRHYTPDQGVVMVFGIKMDLNSLINPVRNLALGNDSSVSQETSVIGASDLRQLVTTLTDMLASGISGITSFVSVGLMALFISFLVLLDLPNLERALPAWIPAAYHRECGLLIQQMGSVWNGFFRGEALIAFIIALLTWLQLTVMGVQNAVVVAVFTGVISLIPTIGGIIALVPIALISLLQGSSVFTDLTNGTFAILVVIVNLVISQLIWNIVAPKIMGDAVKLPLPVILIGIFIGAALGGILGAFLITPIIGTVRVITAYLLKKIARQDPFPGQEPTGAFGTELRSYIQSGRGAGM
ncbi:MAG TPA: AI-2E family transporter [Aggregatilineaceae bacterium]|nr:AI-2E family transporter [Aggregatilineaceae bacterium]